jgi:hypothetical protein
MIKALLEPPPSASAEHPPDWQRHLEWITTMCQNIMAAANDLRPIQVRSDNHTMHRLPTLNKGARQLGGVDAGTTTTAEGRNNGYTRVSVPG